MTCPLRGSSLLLLLCALVFTSANLIQFGRIIEHLTGRFALDYNGYGCYCGWGGSRQPVDAMDWCCQVHDCCYQALSLRHCKPKLEKYLYSVGKDDVTCGGETECRRQTCECDRAAALCFRRSEFQDQYARYSKTLCQGPTPPCQAFFPHTKRGVKAQGDPRAQLESRFSAKLQFIAGAILAPALGSLNLSFSPR